MQKWCSSYSVLYSYPWDACIRLYLSADNLNFHSGCFECILNMRHLPTLQVSVVNMWRNDLMSLEVFWMMTACTLTGLWLVHHTLEAFQKLAVCILTMPLLINFLWAWHNLCNTYKGLFLSLQLQNLCFDCASADHHWWALQKSAYNQAMTY